MEAQEKTILTYVKEDGSAPFNDWLEALRVGKITRGEEMTRSRSYRDDLLKALTDPTEAREYLNAALEDENPEVFKQEKP